MLTSLQQMHLEEVPLTEWRDVVCPIKLLMMNGNLRTLNKRVKLWSKLVIDGHPVVAGIIKDDTLGITITTSEE